MSQENSHKDNISVQCSLRYIFLSDKTRPDSADTISMLHDNNTKSVLPTGDNSKVAEGACRKMGIDIYYAEILPHQKLKRSK